MTDPFPDAPYAEALPPLATPRLQLRALTEADDPAIVALFSDEAALATWTHPPFTSLDDARAYRAQLDEAYRRRASFIWGVFDAAGSLAGVAILTRWAPLHRRADLGYYLGSAYWGRGYATEAGRALLAFAFDRLGVHRVEAEVVPGNAASARVLVRLGFRREARLKERLWGSAEGGDGPFDSDLFRLFRREFEASAPEAE